MLHVGFNVSLSCVIVGFNVSLSCFFVGFFVGIVSKERLFCFQLGSFISLTSFLNLNGSSKSS